jgi:hypothetical protein
MWVGFAGQHGERCADGLHRTCTSHAAQPQWFGVPWRVSPSNFGDQHGRGQHRRHNDPAHLGIRIANIG